MVAATSPAENGLVQDQGETLLYKVKYQGLLSGSLPLEIARVSLHLHPGVQSVAGESMRRATMTLTTESFSQMEKFYPVRLSYDSWFDLGMKYSTAVAMRRHSKKSRHELLWFNRAEDEVRVYRKGKRKVSATLAPPDFLVKISHLQQPAEFRQRRALPLIGGEVLDRLAMLYALRQRSLVPGEVVELAVSNGKDLLGYSVDVEGRELLLLEGGPVATLRLKFTPRSSSNEDPGYVVQVWLSDDEQRLPLRFLNSSFGGVIELNMERKSAD